MLKEGNTFHPWFGMDRSGLDVVKLFSKRVLFNSYHCPRSILGSTAFFIARHPLTLSINSCFLVNGQNWRADPLDKNAETWYRITNSIFAKMVNPLIHRHTQIDNDTRPPDTFSVGRGTTGYPFYLFALTFMGKGSDGTMYEDRRNGSMELFCELDPGAHWPNNYTWMVHAFSRRNYSISNGGQISKNFL